MACALRRTAIMFATAALAVLYASTASAQRVEVLSSDLEGARVRISWGALYADVRDALVPVLPAGARAPNRERIAQRNPGRMRFVCYEAGRHVRPTISVERSVYDACTEYPRGIWFVAGVTYTIPFIQPPSFEEELAPPVVAIDSVEVEALRIEADTLRTRLAARSHELRESQRIAHETETRLEDALEASEARARIRPTATNSFSWGWAYTCIILLVVIAMLAVAVRRLQKLVRRAMAAIRKARALRDDQLDRERDGFSQLEKDYLEIEKHLDGKQGELSEANSQAVKAGQEALGLKDTEMFRKEQIRKLLERREKLRPLEIKTVELRDRLELLKRLKQETPEDDLKPYTDPTYDRLIESAQADFDALGQNSEDVVKEAATIRSELAALIEEATGFREEMVAVDREPARQFEQQMYERLRGEIQTVFEKAKAEQTLLEDERMSIKAERKTYETEISRYKGQLDSKSKELVAQKASYRELDGKYGAILFQGSLEETEALAAIQGELSGLRRAKAETDEFLQDVRRELEAKFHEVLEISRNLEQTNQQFAGQQTEVLKKDQRIHELEQQLGLQRHSQLATRGDTDATNKMKRDPETGVLIVKDYGKT